VKILTALSVCVTTCGLAVALPAYGNDGSSANAQASGSEIDKTEKATPTPTATATPTATPRPRATPTPTPTPSESSDPAPTPVVGETVVTGKHTGTVRVRTPNGDSAEIGEGDELPVGSVLDARAGTVVLSAALPGGGTNEGRFSGGRFEVRQNARSGITDVYLRGGSFARCRTRSLASIASVARTRPRPIRRLWGSDDGGRFRTHGHNSVATVRGTRWLTEDRCEGTLTRVVKGAVDVRDNRTHRRVTVRAGHSHLARAAR
jgi:hypothetical protein